MPEDDSPSIPVWETRIIFFFQHASGRSYGLHDIADVINPIEDSHRRFPDTGGHFIKAMLNLLNSRVLAKDIFPPFNAVRGPNFPRARALRD